MSFMPTSLGLGGTARQNAAKEMKSSITSKGKEVGHGAGGSAAAADRVLIGLLSRRNGETKKKYRQAH